MQGVSTLLWNVGSMGQRGVTLSLGRPPNVVASAVFSFLYFLKIKISKIYVRFEIFQKYTPVALP